MRRPVLAALALLSLVGSSCGQSEEALPSDFSGQGVNIDECEWMTNSVTRGSDAGEATVQAASITYLRAYFPPIADSLEHQDGLFEAEELEVQIPQHDDLTNADDLQPDEEPYRNVIVNIAGEGRETELTLDITETKNGYVVSSDTSCVSLTRDRPELDWTTGGR